MHASLFFAAIALAVVPTLATHHGKLGFALGAKTINGTCKSTKDYEKDFDAIRHNTGSTLVRGYSTSQCDFAKHVLPAAKKKHFRVVLGLWPDTEESFLADKQALVQYAPKYPRQVYGITVGSETLYRGNFTGEQLLNKINDVKAIFPHDRIGTADTFNKFADGTADPLIMGSQGENVGDGAVEMYFEDVQQAMAHIKQVAGSLDGIEFWNGETGWPTTGGSNYGAAIANMGNAARYYERGVCRMLNWGVNVFYFEAFDELWKPPSIGDDGLAENERHWGAMTANRTKKHGFPLKCRHSKTES